MTMWKLYMMIQKWGILSRKGHCIVIRGDFRTLSNISAGEDHPWITYARCTLLPWSPPFPLENRYFLNGPELKVVTYVGENSTVIAMILNMSLMMTVVKYWESISNKIKVLLSELAKKTQWTLILNNGSTYKMNDELIEKRCLCLKNQT